MIACWECGDYVPYAPGGQCESCRREEQQRQMRTTSCIDCGAQVLLPDPSCRWEREQPRCPACRTAEAEGAYARWDAAEHALAVQREGERRAAFAAACSAAWRREQDQLAALVEWAAAATRNR